ncbi:ankyrin repeat domain-containing protein [Sphingorhabdus sp.]|jgi:ankyrin repeat protein|uniref:ankyrin repeat domain-containing protein n=1 Tax=Sphingorhabdus sp. TaxID=1902408 RepID=UPI0028E9A385|nr:ankyrin repeat domain-containing protein [uncultured Sphingorhabdus sp.]MCX7267588.1 ankyrin repeat domain-containing protein [Sphingomonadales bacterium]
MAQILLKKTFFLSLTAGLIVPAAFGVVAPAAYAQFSDSYNFLKAVKDRKGEEAEKFLSEPGSVIINTRDGSTGETALHIVIQRRDSTWLGYLLQKGANPNLADKKGTTPLMLATQLGYVDGIDWLVRKKAVVDQTNRSGETALILAVQLRNPEAVRALLKAGANPDKTDSRAGYSARDYAKQDGRASAIAAIIESNGKADAAATTKPTELDFSGIASPK